MLGSNTGEVPEDLGTTAPSPSDLAERKPERRHLQPSAAASLPSQHLQWEIAKAAKVAQSARFSARMRKHRIASQPHPKTIQP